MLGKAAVAVLAMLFLSVASARPAGAAAARMAAMGQVADGEIVAGVGIAHAFGASHGSGCHASPSWSPHPR